MVARSALTLLAASFLAGAQAGPAASSILNVGAVVLPMAQFRVLASPPMLEITPEDVRRGHVDVPQPSVVAARTNIPGGFAVRVRMDPGLVTAATVTGLGGTAEVAAAAGLLRVPGAQRQETRYELHWRLRLAHRAAAGTYAWPVQMRFEGL